MKKTTIQLLTMLLLPVASSFAHGDGGACLALGLGTIDRSEYTLEQVQTGLRRGFFHDLNNPSTLKYAINEVGLKELNTLICEHANPVPGDAYIDELLQNNSIQPENPDTVALYFDPADEPVTNPMLGQMLAEIFKRGLSVNIGECFRFNINVATADQAEALTLRLSVDRKDQWLFDISELEFISAEEAYRSEELVIVENDCFASAEEIIIIEDANVDTIENHIEAVEVIAESSPLEIIGIEAVHAQQDTAEEEPVKDVDIQGEFSWVSHLHQNYYCPYARFVLQFVPEFLRDINLKTSRC